MKNILLIVLFSMSFTSYSKNDCLNQLDQNGARWARKMGRGQINHFLQFSSKSVAKDSDIGWLVAKGQALEDVLSECDSIPQGLKSFEKCQDEIGGNYYSYIRYSVELKNCNKSSQGSKLLKKNYQDYKDYLKEKNVINKFSCIHNKSKCDEVAITLLHLGKTDEALNLLDSDCKKGNPQSCYLYFEHFYQNNDLSKSLNHLKKSCILNYKLGCFTLYEMSNQKKIKIGKEFDNYFCNSGININCNSFIKNKGNVDVLDNSIKEFDF